MIFNFIIEESLDTQETESVASAAEKLFDSIEVDPIDYDWCLNDVTDEGEARLVCLTNLFKAAQDIDILPQVLDIDDLDFDDDITINLEWYEDDEKEKIREGMEKLMEKTGLTISIEG